MARVRRRFGVGFFVTIAAAAAILASVPFWGMAIEQSQARGCFRRLHDPAASTRAEAADALARLGPAAVPWALRALADDDPAVRVLACSILLRADPDRPAPLLDALAGRLGDAHQAVRRAAADQLQHAAGLLAARAGAEATARTIAALRRAIGDRAQDVRLGALDALATFGPAARSAIPDLDRALREAEPTFRVHVAEALLRIDPAGAKARVVAALGSALADPAARGEEDRAVRLLKEQLGEDGAAAVLIPLLHHGDAGVRQVALGGLVERCPAARATWPALVALLDGPDIWIRDEVALLLLERDPTLAGRACDALVDQLLNLRDGGFPSESIINGLRARSPASIPPIAERLIEAIEYDDAPDRRRNAIDALGVIGIPEAIPAVAALREASAAPDRAVALRAVGVLARLDPEAAAASLPALLGWIQPDEENVTRLTALLIIGDLGPLAKSALPSLLRAADEDDIRLSTAAIEALGQVDPARAAELKELIREGR